jgi:hypothetical protein
LAAIQLVGPNTAAHPHPRQRFPFFIAALGNLGILQDSWPALPRWPSCNLHTAFGVLLMGMIIANFYRASSGAPLTRADAQALSRQLSRLVYLLLYVIFGAQLLLRVAILTAATSQPPDNLRDYFGYGVLALFAIRVLALLSVRRPPALRMSLR